MKDINILVFPAGTEIGLEINRSLVGCKHITMFGANSAESNHAPLVFKNYFNLPSIYDTNFMEELNAVVKKYSIDYIYPGHDDVLLFLSENSDKTNAKIICSDRQTCRIARSKKLTYKNLDGVVRIPKIFNSIEDVDKYPVFVKPDVSQGSLGARAICSKEDLRCALKQDTSLLIMELLPGEEFTVDCFSDREGGLLYAAGRKRIRTRNGISMNSCFEDNKLFKEIAEKINKKISFNGAWFFQVKFSELGELKLLEIAPRIAGTMCLSRAIGINLPLLSIYEQERMKIKILQNNFDVEVDRALVNRFRISIEFDKVYVDLDDTLIINDRVNESLIFFLYQCLNNKKSLILLTRHNSNTIREFMSKHRIENLFDEIYILRDGDKKSSFIKEKAIFIDDSFKERADVLSSKAGVAVFDVNQIEALIDYKI